MHVRDRSLASFCSKMLNQEVKKVGKELGIEPTIIQGEQLREKGFGGIYGCQQNKTKQLSS